MDPYWSPEATMLWISLDRATAANGALCFLPGTQLEARREAAPIDEGFGDEGVGAMLETRPEWQAIDPVRQHPHARCPALQPQACCEASLRVAQVCVETEPGDAILIDPMVAHAAGANMTNRPRRAFAMLLMPRGARYNGQPAALPASLAARLEVGEEIIDDELPPF